MQERANRQGIVVDLGQQINTFYLRFAISWNIL